jgi:hypothetical protein
MYIAMTPPDWIKALSVALLLFGAGAAAQESKPAAPLARSVELPSHRWLAQIREAPSTQLAPFTTDGCSGGMSSLWTYTADRFPAFAEAHNGRPPWEPCCVTHDRAYHAAGNDLSPDASYDARLEADRTLRACVAATADSRDEILTRLYGLTEEQIRHVYQAIAGAMFQAVRLGGGPCTGLPWRWGYGYPQCWERPDG